MRVSPVSAIRAEFIIGDDFAVCADEGKTKKSPAIVDRADRALVRFRSIWSYVGKSLSTTRALLNASIRSCFKHLDSKIAKVVVRLRLFSVCNVIAESHSASVSLRLAIKNRRLRDHEGTALAALGVVSSATDAFDSSTSFINAVLLTASKAPIDFLAKAGSPATIIACTLCSGLRAYQIKSAATLWYDLQRDIIARKDLSEDPAALTKALREFLKVKAGITDAELAKVVEKCASLPPEQRARERDQALLRLQAIKDNFIKRTVHPAAIDDLNALTRLLQTTDGLKSDDVSAVFSRLHHLCSILKKKMAIDVGAIVSNVLLCLGLLLMGSAALPAVLPFLMLASAFILKLSLQVYQQRCIKPL